MDGISDLGTRKSTQSATETKKISRKRNFSEQNPVLKLSDNKERHLEKQLSARQRDALFIQEIKDDAPFHKDSTGAITQLDETFAMVIQQMSSSVLQVAQLMTRSIEMLSHAMLVSNNPQQTHFPTYQTYHANSFPILSNVSL